MSCITKHAATPPLVLVVEDVLDQRELYVEYLSLRGLRVIAASNGEEAIRLAREHRPTVIVMDMALPILDGWQATRGLKADTSTASICIIALTAHAGTSSKTQCLEAGCDYFLAKPCAPSELLRTILGCTVSLGSSAASA